MSLSPVMLDVITRLQAASDPRLVRLPGGFWTIPGTPLSTTRVPAWYVTRGTIKALEARGILESIPEPSLASWALDRHLAHAKPGTELYAILQSARQPTGNTA